MLCVIWGSTWLAIRIGLQGAPPFLAASLRFFVASATLAVLALPFRSKWPANRTEWKLVVFVGLVLFTADYGLIYWGENNGVESGLSAILFATLPLLTAVVANALLPGERLTVQKLAGIGLGFGGILLIFRGQIATAGADKAFPMIAIVLSATCAAVATVALKRWGAETDPVTFNAGAMPNGAASLAALSVTARETWRVPSWPEGIGAILFLALAGSVVTYVTWQWLLQTAEATSLSVTPRWRSMRSRKDAMNACWSFFDRASAKSLIRETSRRTSSGAATIPADRNFSATACDPVCFPKTNVRCRPIRSG